MYINEIKNKIIWDDCINVLRNLSNNLIDLILTDPPYGAKQDKGAHSTFILRRLSRLLGQRGRRVWR